MNWILDTYHTVFGQEDINAMGCCTGKTTLRGGFEKSSNYVGYGAYICLKTLLENEYILNQTGLTKGIKGKTVIVQGYGNAGYSISHFLTEKGAKVIGVSEYDCSIYDENGIDIESLYDFKQHHPKQGIYGYPKVNEWLQPEEALYKKCDILISAAVSRTINQFNAPKLQCKIIGEIADGSTTPKAEIILAKNNILIFPELIMNAGGLVASYFEWLKNLDHRIPGKMTKMWEERSKLKLLDLVGELTDIKIDKNNPNLANILAGASEIDIVRSGFEEIFPKAVNNTIDTAIKLKTSLRLATYINALNKLHKFYEQASILPNLG